MIIIIVIIIKVQPNLQTTRMGLNTPNSNITVCLYWPDPKVQVKSIMFPVYQLETLDVVFIKYFLCQVSTILEIFTYF